MVERNRLLQPKHRKYREDGECDDLLYRLEFGHRIVLVPGTIGRNCQQVFEKRHSQLTSTTIQSGDDLKWRCRYHAKVMKTLDATRSSTGRSVEDIMAFGF